MKNLVLALVLAAIPATSFAQDGETTNRRPGIVDRARGGVKAVTSNVKARAGIGKEAAELKRIRGNEKRVKDLSGYSMKKENRAGIKGMNKALKQKKTRDQALEAANAASKKSREKQQIKSARKRIGEIGTAKGKKRAAKKTRAAGRTR